MRENETFRADTGPPVKYARQTVRREARRALTNLCNYAQDTCIVGGRERRGCKRNGRRAGRSGECAKTLWWVNRGTGWSVHSIMIRRFQRTFLAFPSSISVNGLPAVSMTNPSCDQHANTPLNTFRSSWNIVSRCPCHNNYCGPHEQVVPSNKGKGQLSTHKSRRFGRNRVVRTASASKSDESGVGKGNMYYVLYKCITLYSSRFGNGMVGFLKKKWKRIMRWTFFPGLVSNFSWNKNL